MKELLEGLREGDLENMVLPMLSIDEFDSKIDNNQIIVVAFFCMEENAAHDLSNFIERSPTNVIDTDVSPAPNREGYYLTFVEMRRNKLFVQLLLQLLQEVSKLTRVSDWQFTSFALPKGKIVELNLHNLQKHVKLKADPTNMKEKLQEFFAASSLHDFQLQENHLILSRAGIVHEYELGDLIVDRLPEITMCMESNAASAALRLSRLLDGTYNVHAVMDGLLVENTQLDHFLHLKIAP